MMSTPIPPISPDDENPADDLKTDVVEDIERDDTITGDLVGGRDGAESDAEG